MAQGTAQDAPAWNATRQSLESKLGSVFYFIPRQIHDVPCVPFGSKTTLERNVILTGWPTNSLHRKYYFEAN